MEFNLKTWNGLEPILSNRNKFVSYSDSKTEMETVKCGVPQHSILESCFFLIFVNDLNNSTKVLDTVLFAPDTNLFCSDNNTRALFETANQELRQVNLQINYP